MNEMPGLIPSRQVPQVVNSCEMSCSDDYYPTNLNLLLFLMKVKSTTWSESNKWSHNERALNLEFEGTQVRWKWYTSPGNAGLMELSLI